MVYLGIPYLDKSFCKLAYITILRTGFPCSRFTADSPAIALSSR